MLSWPANHPEADMPVDELLTLARLGVLDEQQGYRDGPIFLRCPHRELVARRTSAPIGILARLIARERTGHAGPAHTRMAQGALVPMAMHWRRVEHAVAVAADRHAQGADRRLAVRVAATACGST